ncbi:hypothetical protein M5D96_006832, partial [Drosophila gunungcola]
TAISLSLSVRHPRHRRSARLGKRFTLRIEPRIPRLFATVAERRGDKPTSMPKIAFSTTNQGPGNTTSPTSSAGAAIVDTSSGDEAEAGAGAGAGFVATGAIIELLRRYCYCHGQSLASAGWSSWLQIWCEIALSRSLFSPSSIGHSGARVL